MTFLRSSSSGQDTAADPAPSEAIGLVSATAEAQTRNTERTSMEAAGKVDNDDLHETKCTKDPILMRDYTYNLNVESIAQYPAKPRGSSRLLRVDEDGNVSHYDHFAQSFHNLAQGAHIVFNESKVANARVFVTDMANNTNCSDENEDGTLYSLSLEMMILDVGDLVACKASGLGLNVMLRKKDVQVGEVFVSETDSSCRFQVSKVIGEWVEDEHSNGNGSEVIVECVVLDANVTLAGLLDAVGSVPIPPYLNRSAEDSDVTDYNNVFASEAGSVAAPTAGLHFTNELLAQIGADNISYLSLHVGAGTFQPVMAENAADHKMHGENFHVNVRELQRIIQALIERKRLIVVGTTSARTLESLYWCGVKKLSGMCTDGFNLEQEEWMDLMHLASKISAVAALRALIDNKSVGDMIDGRTHLMIVPNKYKFNVVSELVTNFHAPDSTLMLLVSAFLGGGLKVKCVYEDAQVRGYRFLSYGDVCFLSRTRLNC